MLIAKSFELFSILNCIYSESFQGSDDLKNEFSHYTEQYSADLTRLCMSLCGNKTEAEDLFQETWLKAMRHYGRYDKTKPFDKWLFSICVNTYKNVLNSAYRRLQYSFSSSEESDTFFNSIPEIDNTNRDDYSELHTAIRNLTKKKRTVIVLYFFKDYSISDIAEILNVPEGTVKSRLSSAKSDIRRRMTHE